LHAAIQRRDGRGSVWHTECFARSRSMIISALVLTLDHARADETIARLAAEPRLLLGQRIDNRLPVVTEVGTLGEGRDLYQALEQTPGVLLVSLVRVDLHTEEAA
jgi:hypothetical protein